MIAPSETNIARLTELLGQRPRDFRAAKGGYTATERWHCEIGGMHLFVKIATSPVTADMIRRETQNYYALSKTALGFLPTFVAAEDDSEAPLLVIENLQGAYWPPPWQLHQIDEVLAVVETMHSLKAPACLSNTSDRLRQEGNGWKRLAEDPSPWIGLKLASVNWLNNVLPTLIAAADACNFNGDRLCHFDLRSDNLCLTDSGVKLIDWTEACASNPRVDTGAWLPSLAMEGGPEPSIILPDEPEIAAWVAGYFAARAGLPKIPDAPGVRDLQRAQLVAALPWIVEELDLPPPESMQ